MKESSFLPALILLKESANNVAQITHIRNSRFIIGRGSDASLKILHKGISRKHCTIEREGSNQWTITANTSNLIKLNGKPLRINEPASLKCGDKINLVGVTILIFKCSPDQNQKCCSDIEERKIANKELRSDTEVSCSSSSSQLFEGVQPRWLASKVDRKYSDSCDSESLTINADSESRTTSSELETHDSLLTLEDLKNAIQNYRKYSSSTDVVESCNNSQIATNLKILDDVEQGLNKLRWLYNFKSFCSTLTYSNGKNREILLKLKQLVSSVKDEYPVLHPCDSSKCDERLSRIISVFESLRSEYTESIMCYICTFLKNFFLENSCNFTPQIGENSEISASNIGNNHSSTELKISDIKNDSEEIILKNELKDYKQNAEWQEARIKYLEMKLKERDKLEVELETAREKNETLETYNMELKRALAKKEVVELELQLLKETYKYKEDDKRSKDALECEISNLKSNVQILKDENEKLTSNRYLLETEISTLKRKYEELEIKLKEKNTNSGSGCSSDSSDEFCCDVVKEVKGSLIDLMEKEFNCCICGEIFIEATVTNCNHVFCAYCLKEWKKKKKQCPFCRSSITKECRAPVMDEFITNLTKLISDKSYAERIQLLDERKSAGTPPAAKRARRTPVQARRSVVVSREFRNPFPPTPVLFPYQ